MIHDSLVPKQVICPQGQFLGQAVSMCTRVAKGWGDEPRLDASAAGHRLHPQNALPGCDALSMGPCLIISVLQVTTGVICLCYPLP